MKKTEIGKSFKKSLSKANFTLKKHSPEILVVVGVIGTVTGAVMACRATLKVNEVLDGAKDDIRKIKEIRTIEVEGNENGVSRIDYTEQDYKKDLTIIYAQTGLKLVKLYAPSVALGTLSLCGILASNNILRKRNVALAAAYATVEKGFREYRNRVIERFGENVDQEIRHNVKSQKVEATVVDENGKEKKVKETINVVDRSSLGAYSFFFDESSRYWEKDGDYNRMFLSAQQQFANDRLRARGYLYLNEVLESLGIEGTKAGQIVGWIYDDKNPDGDNYIDFGIYEAYQLDEDTYVKELALGEKIGKEKYNRVVCLDFNVDGNIWDLM